MLELGGGHVQACRGGGVVLRVWWRQGGVTLPVRGLSILQISHGKHGTPRLFSGPLVHILAGREGVILNSFSNRSASIPVADRVIFPESETDPVILPLEAPLFLPAGLKIRNDFLFFSWLPRPLVIWASAARSHPLTIVLSSPSLVFSCSLLSVGHASPKALCTLRLLCREQ